MTAKISPAQQKLLAAIAEGRQLVRDCGLYWLRDPRIKTGQRMDPVSTAVVNNMVRKRLLKCAGRLPENPMMDLYTPTSTA